MNHVDNKYITTIEYKLTNIITNH